MNKVFILGNVGRDPELRNTASGNAVCNFSVATSEKWKDKSGEKHERTEWHNIVLWRQQALLADQEHRWQVERQLGGLLLPVGHRGAVHFLHRQRHAAGHGQPCRAF